MFIIQVHFNPQYDSGTRGSPHVEEVVDFGRKGSDPWGSFLGDVLGQTLYSAREWEGKDHHADSVTTIKAAYLQARRMTGSKLYSMETLPP